MLTFPVAFARLQSYDDAALQAKVGSILDAAKLPVKRGSRVLVKPNLLLAHELSCTSPQITAAACSWLLDNGAKITIADSPAFGTAKSVSRAIGLEKLLAPLGLCAQDYGKPVKIRLNAPGLPDISRSVASEALDCDFILSVPRVKAHSQLRMTLAVKNCFGCICGIRKALAHASPSITLADFAAYVAALWSALSPVAALCDGVIAMSVTGPRNGKPYNMGLIGASASAPALDKAILEILAIDATEIPLSMALEKRAEAGDENASPQIAYVLAKPQDFPCPGFQTPQKLKNISFNPWVLAKSLIRRIWSSHKDRHLASH